MVGSNLLLLKTLKPFLRKVTALSAICMLFAYAGNVSLAQKGSTIIYSQRAERDDMFFVMPFYPRHGRVYITDDSIIFKAKDIYNDVFNFSLAICDIRYIRTYYNFIIPNRIRIMTKRTGSVRIFTYRRRTLIRLTRERMAACAIP
jgi:hypothetical protein